jgi:hypothetical protein
VQGIGLHRKSGRQWMKVRGAEQSSTALDSVISRWEWPRHPQKSNSHTEAPHQSGRTASTYLAARVSGQLQAQSARLRMSQPFDSSIRPKRSGNSGKCSRFAHPALPDPMH